MIRIVIGNKDVVLSDDMTFDFIRENAMLTKASDYTYDIDIDLRIPANKQLYSHIDRINSSNRPTDRIAEIWDNNKLLVRGTEAILKVEGYKAKIQILANNSALNYAFDENVKVRSLDFGTCETRSKAAATSLIGKFYGDNDGTVYECYPLVKVGDKLYNGLFGSGNEYDEDELRPMPFVLFLLDKLIESLGYSIGENHINQSKYKRLCVIHGYDTDQYAKMLPNWTVREMIEEYEKFFNVVFFFNSKDKVVDILSVDTFYETVGDEFVGVDDVIDEHDCDYGSSSEDMQNSYVHVGYKLPSSEIWKFQNIPSDVYDLCSKEDKLLVLHEEQVYDPKDLKIFKDTVKNVEWINWEQADDGDDDDDEAKYPMLVNMLRDYAEDADVAKTELRIIPAWCESCPANHNDKMHLAAVVDEAQLGSGNLSDVIRGGDDTTYDTMQVSFYLGYVHLASTYDGSSLLSDEQYPAVRSVYWQQYKGLPWTLEPVQTGGVITTTPTITLELCGQYGRVNTELHNAVYIDDKKLYTIKFKTRKFLDPRKKFVIANRLWYCKQLKYKVERGGVDVIVEGEFYPAKTSQ